MKNNTDRTKQALATAEGPTSLSEMVEKSAREIGKALPQHMRPERVVRIALTCIRQTPELARCNPASFVGALLVSAQLGLEPLAGRAYILPFFNSKTGQKEAQFLIGYRGLAELFYRHQKAIQLAWGTVKSNDEFEYEYGTNSYLRHRPAMKAGGEVLGYYVVAELRGGAKPFMWMSKEECMAHGRQHSKTYSEKVGRFSPLSPWATNPDAMCQKTVLIQLAKLLPLAIELQQAIGADETSREYREGIDSALDIPVSEWNGGKGELVGDKAGQPVKEAPAVKAPQPKKKEEATYTVRPGKSAGVYNVVKEQKGKETVVYHMDMQEGYCSCPSRLLPCKHQKLVADYIRKQEKGQNKPSKARKEATPTVTPNNGEKPVKYATKAMIALLSHLGAQAKLSPATILDMAGKHGCSKLEELTFSAANEIIDELRGLVEGK